MNDVDRTLVSAIFVACYVPIGRFLVCEKIASKNRLDWFTIIAGAACFLPALDWSPSLILVTFYILSFIGRFGKEGDTLEEKVKNCENAELLMPSVYAAVSDISSYEAVNIAYPEIEKVTAWA